MKISIVIPVYNEESTIGPVLDEVDLVPIDKEVIVVDDGSVDATPEIIRGHLTEPICEHLAANAGKGAAVRRGLELATGEVIVIQDADLELAPARILALVAPICAGEVDVVYGSRFLDSAGRVPVARRLANAGMTWLFNRLYGTALTDVNTAHKAFRADLLRRIPLQASGFEIDAEISAKLVRCGASITEIPNPYEPRTKDQGKKIRWRHTFVMLGAVFRFRRWQPDD